MTIIFYEAISSKEIDKWITGVEEWLKPMQLDEVRELVDLPEGIIPIGYEWVVNTKKDFKGNFDLFKVRLVAKGSSS